MLAQVLRPLTEAFRAADYPNLLMGLDGLDDAAVYRVSDDLAVVLTVDFFAPVVDDPYTYGAVAAANAMSDVYAMGGEVLLALNVVGFPQELPPAILAEILRGGADKVAEGGRRHRRRAHHIRRRAEVRSLRDGHGAPRPHGHQGRRAAGRRALSDQAAGDGHHPDRRGAGIAEPAHVQAAVDSMLALNRRAFAHRRRERRPRDGRRDRLWPDGARRGDRQVERRGAQDQRRPAAAAAGRARLRPSGIGTGGGARNREALTDSVTIADDIDEAMVQVLFDPQTSGGLLVALPADKATSSSAAWPPTASSAGASARSQRVPE